MLEQYVPERLYPVVQTHAEALLEELQFVGSPCWISSGRVASCGRDSMLEQKSIKMKEHQWWSIMDWPQPSFLVPLHLLGEQGRKGWMGGKVFFFGLFLVSHWCSLLSIGNKLYQSPLCWICFAYDGNWWGISLYSSQPMNFFFIIFSPHPSKEEKWESSVVVPFYRTMLNHHEPSN